MSASIIRDTLKEINEKVFFPQSIRLELLKEYPGTIPILAQWMYDEWHSYDATLTKERLVDSFKNRLNNNKMPFTLVALRNSEPIGIISLIEKGEPEFIEFINTSPWISLQVPSKERNKGLEQELLSAANTIAARLGYEKLFVYTSHPDKVEWFIKNGAQLIEQRPFRGHTITMMEIRAKV